MLKFEVIGNLGRNAEVKTQDGKSFVKFNVAHTDRFTTEGGEVKETTQWVSCIWNGDGGRLLPFLVAGTKVFVTGRGSSKLYSSAKERCMKAGLNLSVEHIELVGGQSDPVPSKLYDMEGLEHQVSKHYYVQPSNPASPAWPDYMLDAKNNRYNIVNGFALPDSNNNAPGNAEESVESAEIEDI